MHSRRSHIGWKVGLPLRFTILLLWYQEWNALDSWLLNERIKFWSLLKTHPWRKEAACQWGKPQKCFTLCSILIPTIRCLGKAVWALQKIPENSSEVWKFNPLDRIRILFIACCLSTAVMTVKCPEDSWGSHSVLPTHHMSMGLYSTSVWELQNVLGKRLWRQTVLSLGMRWEAELLKDYLVAHCRYGLFVYIAVFYG